MHQKHYRPYEPGQRFSVFAVFPNIFIGRDISDNKAWLQEKIAIGGVFVCPLNEGGEDADGERPIIQLLQLFRLAFEQNEKEYYYASGRGGNRKDPFY